MEKGRRLTCAVMHSLIKTSKPSLALFTFHSGRSSLKKEMDIISPLELVQPVVVLAAHCHIVFIAGQRKIR